MPTLNDVARHAGVTAATVSNVIRGRGAVSAKTAAHVRTVVAALGYRPNLAARALAEGRAPALALLVPSIANHFYTEFARAAERRARAEGKLLVVCHSDSDPDIGCAYLDRVASGIAEGVLAMAGDIRPRDLIEVAARGVPVVLVMWEESDETIPLPAVTLDFTMAGQIAAEHLLELGHRKIGLVTPNAHDGIEPHTKRVAGFEQAIAKAGEHIPESQRTFGSDTIAGGFAAATELLEKTLDITAVFASNDLMAIGAMQAAAAVGLRVPEDLSIISVTDIQLASQMRPALTTVSLHSTATAELAVTFLLELVESPTCEILQREGPKPVLQLRATTAPPRRLHG